jgi:hypothetical protein
MALERKDPIPPGVYWVDAVNQTRGVAQWYAWERENKATVEVLKRKIETPLYFWEMDGYIMWVLFRVKAPTKRWEVNSRLGLPTIAPETTKQADTVKRPKKRDTAEYWKDETKGVVQPYTAGIGTAIGGLLLLYLLSKGK